MELYALVLDGKILTPTLFKEYWKNYGNNDLYGWKPPKKIYFTLGRAKAGKKWIPKELQDKVEIHRFTSSGKIEE